MRIIDATLACLARHGTVKTTVDDIAREAGCVPGHRVPGRSPAAGTRSWPRWSTPRWPGCSRPSGSAWARPSDLADALVAGIVEASTRVRGHAALAYLVEHEPEVVLGHLAFDESDRLLATASRFTAPFLARWMSPDEAGRVAEWATRIVLSYAIAPSPAWT